MSYFIEQMDYDKHNEEVARVWQAFNAKKPVRVPVILGINSRIYLLNPDLNKEGITFQQYSEDPDLMARVQMLSQDYIRHNMIQDAEMGMPKDGWNIYVDLQNVYEAAWFGAKVEYRPGQVPDTSPILGGSNKRMLFDRGFPDPFTSGIMAKNWDFYERMKANRSKYIFKGLPVINVGFGAGAYTDGPMTVAASLRGATELCMDIYEDPDYFHELLAFITQATIKRIKAFRKALGLEMKPQSWGFADDSIELLSVDIYKEFVLPYHKMLLNELAGKGPHAMHLCGDAGRLMPIIRNELNVQLWDAGFPVDYAKARELLGPDFQIQTGPTVATLLQGTPEEVDEESRRILESGIMRGGRFVLREANNLSPCTPAENVKAMYEAAKKYGTFE
ncbi:MAG: uroporphyrinogen decarboxylase family protein [Armatimonadota bacterium]